MKNILIVLFSFLAAISYSQAPQGIPYQAVARNSSGAILASIAIRVRFTIHDSIATGAIVYQETFNPTTTTHGLFSLNVGQGTAVSGTFSTINWGINAKFMQVEMDPAGGTSYIDMGTQQMMSVPFALNSNSSNSIKLSVSYYGDTLFTGSNNYVIIPNISAANHPMYVGMSYGGGVIAYLLQPGDVGYTFGEVHGLIAAPNDQSASAPWGCDFVTFSSSAGFYNTISGIGFGRLNTLQILLADSTIGIAAQLCNSYNGGGFTDWYLPSFEELGKLYDNKLYIGGFMLSYPSMYWSSNAGGSFGAKSREFNGLYGGGEEYGWYSGRTTLMNVRAVRSF